VDGYFAGVVFGGDFGVVGVFVFFVYDDEPKVGEWCEYG